MPCPPLSQLLLPQPLLQLAVYIFEFRYSRPVVVRSHIANCHSNYLGTFHAFPLSHLLHKPLQPTSASSSLFQTSFLSFLSLNTLKSKSIKVLLRKLRFACSSHRGKAKHFSFQPVFFILITYTLTHMKLLCSLLFFFNKQNSTLPCRLSFSAWCSKFSNLSEVSICYKRNCLINILLSKWKLRPFSSYIHMAPWELVPWLLTKERKLTFGVS